MSSNRVEAPANGLREQSAVIGADLQELGQVAKEAAQESVRHVRDTAAEYVATGRKKIGDMGKSTEHYVAERPFKALALATGAGILLGYLFSRR